MIKTSLCGLKEKMSDHATMHDENLKTNIASDDGKQEEFLADTLKIAVRNANDLLQPNKGVRPDPADDGKLETSSTFDNPCSVTTGKDDSNNVVNRDDLNSTRYVKTSMNSPEVKATTDPSQEEGIPSTPVETEGVHTIAKQGKGQPTTASQSRWKSNMLNAPKEKRKKLGLRKAALTRKDRKKWTWQQNNAAKMMSVFLGDRILRTACLFLLFGGVHSFKGPPNQVVKIGDQVFLTCYTELKYNIKWFKDDKLIYSGYGFVVEFKDLCRIGNETSGHHDLIINHAEEQMAGIYTCQQSQEVKNISARLIIVAVTVETNVTAVACTAVITGDVMTKILWQVIHDDGITNETGTVALINSDTIGGIKKQTITSGLILTKNYLHTSRVCRMFLVFNDAGRSPFILGPAEQMADNVPIYAVDIPCMTNAVENRTATPLASTGHVWIAIGVTAIIVVASVIASVITVIVCVCKQRKRKQQNNSEMEMERNSFLCMRCGQARGQLKCSPDEHGQDESLV